MKIIVVACLAGLGLAFSGCNSTGGNNYRDFSSSNQRRAGSDNPETAASRHDRGASEAAPSTADETDENQQPSTDDPHSKVHVVQDASEKETRTGMVTERVENRPSSKPTPTPTDNMNKPLDPIGRPLTAPTP